MARSRRRRDVESTELESRPEAPSTRGIIRCTWADNDPLLVAYHDDEWGKPELASRTLWEALMLGVFQAGLSWAIILRKREAFRDAFDRFDPEIVARYGTRDIARLMHDEGIVRSHPKVLAVIENARAYLAMEAAGEDLASLIWSAAGGPVEWPEHAVLAIDVAEALVDRGFRFIGPLIVHAWLRAAGVINEHDEGCFLRDSPRARLPF